MSKWRVVKRDGAWQALDGEGDVRYASSQWDMALAFALIAAEKATNSGVRLTWSVEDVREWWNDINWWKRYFGNG